MYKLLKSLSLWRNLLKQAIPQGEENKSCEGKYCILMGTFYYHFYAEIFK